MSTKQLVIYKNTVLTPNFSCIGFRNRAICDSTMHLIEASLEANLFIQYLLLLAFKILCTFIYFYLPLKLFSDLNK